MEILLKFVFLIIILNLKPFTIRKKLDRWKILMLYLFYYYILFYACIKRNDLITFIVYE